MLQKAVFSKLDSTPTKGIRWRYATNTKNLFIAQRGKSATAAAAYRAGEHIYDERSGKTHDFTRKGDVIHSIMR